MNVPFDLSNVVFVATANRVQPIPPPLLDRMEVIELPGYTPEEKLRIAMRHLIPRVLDQHGLSSEFLQIPEVLNFMIFLKCNQKNQTYSFLPSWLHGVQLMPLICYHVLCFYILYAVTYSSAFFLNCIAINIGRTCVMLGLMVGKLRASGLLLFFFKTFLALIRRPFISVEKMLPHYLAGFLK